MAATCLLSVAVAAVAIVAVLAGREPHAPRGVGATVVLALTALGAVFAVRWASWSGRSLSPPALALEPLVVAAVAAVAAAVAAAGTLRTLRARAAIDRLGAQLSNPETAARAVSGAIRGVEFAMPGGGWIDATGRAVPDPPARGGAVVLSDPSGPLLRLLLAGRADQDAILAGLTPATRLALRNGQLAAVVAARLAEVRASQRRVVALSDAERRRIERDLHDGAQQRLVSVAFHLGAAMAGADQAVAGRLASPYARVRAALAQLRQLAHGMGPGALVDEGLPAALQELAAASDVPVTLDVRAGRLPDDVAMAAYATVVAALESVERPAQATRARVSVVQDDAMLTVRAEVTGGDGTVRAPDCTDAADRVGALGGRLTCRHPTAEGTLVTAVIPCGS